MNFPLWLRATHFLTIVFISFLARSGLEILSACPRLYLNDHCKPGSEWLTLSRRRLPQSGLWTSTDMEEKWPSWLALPGGRHLGLGRHWHFVSVIGWILTGLVYVVLLFTADEWRRLVPTSFSIFPEALRVLRDYLTLHITQDPASHYNALQQLTYFGVVFIIAPLQIASGAAMSPAIDARFPAYVRLFGGRQRARSLHFALLLLFAVFVAGHTLLVALHGIGFGLSRIVMGTPGTNEATGIFLGAAGLAAIVALHVLANVISLRRPAAVRRAAGAIMGVPQRFMSQTLSPSMRGADGPVSPYHWLNGRPPVDESYREMLAGEFRDWRLKIAGLVETPLVLTVGELREFPATERRSLHHCIQGWSSVADWRGVPMADLLRRCQPKPEAEYAVFYAMDDKAQTDHQGEGHFWEAVRLDILEQAGAFLAYEMNGAPLTAQHGAPVRLRLDNQLGFKMVKWIHHIELVADISSLGDGSGGWREQHLQFENAVAI